MKMIPCHLYCTVITCIGLCMLVGATITSAQAQTGENGTHDTLRVRDLYTLRQGLNHFYNACLQKHTATVAFLGGSITYNPGWRNKVCDWLTTHFPQTSFHFIAAGIPSLGSLPHVFRLQQDVLDSGRTDLLFVEAAVNDRVNKTDSLTQIRSLEGIVRHAKKSNPCIDIIMMSFADTFKLNDYDKGITPVEIANHERVATHYHLPSINLGKEVYDRIANHEFDWVKDFKDLHPSPFGQELYFTAIKNLLSDAGTAFKKGNNDPCDGLPKPLDNDALTNGSYYGVQHAKPDARWVLQRDWTPADTVNTRAGFVHVPVLEASEPGATLTLSFKGSAIGISVVAGPDAGIIEYAIDGSAFKQVNLYTEWSGHLHLPWYILFASGLTNRQHVLTIRISNGKQPESKGHACRIVHFLVNQ